MTTSFTSSGSSRESAGLSGPWATDVLASRWQRAMGEVGDRLSDLCSPIVVKEIRQLLKSREFLSCFVVAVIACWSWAIAVISYEYPSMQVNVSGRPLLVGYTWILAVLTFLVIPISAFRALSSEREDGTYELIAITRLSGRQLAAGKWSVAIVQLIIFYAIISPCITMTYLLGGIDLMTIGTILMHAFEISLMLSAIGIYTRGISA